MPSKQYSDEELSKMEFGELSQLRTQATSQEEQNRYANYEHRASVRDEIRSNPAVIDSMPLAIPAYYVGKQAGVLKGRSEATGEQVKQAAIGVVESVAERGVTGLAEFANVPARAAKIVAAVPWERIWQKTTDVVKATGEAIEGSLPWQKTWTREGVNKLNTEPSGPLEEASTKLSIQDILPKLISAESSGKHVDAKTGKLLESPKGAKGITQVMPKTAKNPGYGVKPMKNDSEEEYIRFTTDYVTALHKKFEGDWEKTLAAYNWGVGKVSTALGKAERFGQDWKEHLPKETKDYLSKILGKKKDA
jgi:hypothetical protein